MGKEKGTKESKMLHFLSLLVIFKKACATITLMILFTEPTGDELRQAVSVSAAVLQERDHEED